MIPLSLQLQLHEVSEAIDKLERGKGDDYLGLSSDNLINVCSIIFAGTQHMTFSTTVPIP